MARARTRWVAVVLVVVAAAAVAAVTARNHSAKRSADDESPDIPTLAAKLGDVQVVVREIGTVEPGKLADFVILSGNPLTVDENELADLVVLETIKEDVSIYTRPDGVASRVSAAPFGVARNPRPQRLVERRGRRRLSRRREPCIPIEPGAGQPAIGRAEATVHDEAPATPIPAPLFLARPRLCP